MRGLIRKRPAITKVVATLVVLLFSSYFELHLMAEEKSSAKGQALHLRVGRTTLRNPYWYAEQGDQSAAQNFWDKKQWEKILTTAAEEGCNAIVYWVEPWQQHQWQTFLIRHTEYPEARDYTPEQYDRVIEQVSWVFDKAHGLGLKNFLFTYFVMTTPSFAKAHDMDKEMPLSPFVDFRHNLKAMGFHVGVRNELTRAFTEKSLGELFKTYKSLDGLYGGMGEGLPGKKSSWYKEAVVPGLKRSGRHPIFILSNWMLPLEDFLEDIAPKDVYDNTWLAIHANGEMLSDAKPYPDYVRWAERSGLPTIMEIMVHNFEGGFPYNSPKLAYDLMKEYRKVENYTGFLSWVENYATDPNSLFRRAVVYYSKTTEPYSDEPWIKVLEERFGDRAAAAHFLRAYNASAYITPEVCALAWHPTDGIQGRQLSLKYFFFTNENPRQAGWYTSPSRGASLIPPRRYAQVVAKHGSKWRDNNGSDYARPPYAQEYIWGMADYPTTPEEHMRRVRRLGEESLKEAEEAMKTVKKNHEEARALYNYMKGYKLLADYYERKVLAAISALIYSLGGPKEEKAQAERLAGEAVGLYETANYFIWENIDKKTGKMKANWQGKEYNLPELLQYEKKEREQLGNLFNWSSEQQR